MKRWAGFTLIELMMVIAIVSILSIIAYPAYQERVIKTRRTDGHTALLNLAVLMEHYYTENNTYTGATPVIVGGGALSTEGYYTLSISDLTDTAYVLSAIPVATSPQAADTTCGTLTLTSTNIKGPSTTCWS